MNVERVQVLLMICLHKRRYEKERDKQKLEMERDNAWHVMTGTYLYGEECLARLCSQKKGEQKEILVSERYESEGENMKLGRWQM